MPAATPYPLTPDRARLAAPVLGGPEQSDILDWEWAALPHEEDPSVVCPDEDEAGDDEEWLDEISYVLAGPGAPTQEPGAPAQQPGLPAAQHPGPPAAQRPGAPAQEPSAPAQEPGAADPGPIPAPPKPEDFARGGPADALAPGPVLAMLVDLVQRDGLGKLDDDQLTGVLQAASRLAALVRRAETVRRVRARRPP